MLRRTSLSLACVLAGIMPVAAEVLVNTRLNPLEIVASDATIQLDLTEHFQRYADPGPVATFSLHMPVQEDFKSLYVEYTYDDDNNIVPLDEGVTFNMMTYQLSAGGSYTNAYEVGPEQFVWQDNSVQFQLLADQAPITVANFMTYVWDGAYDNTIVHRSEIGVLQAGGLRLYPTDEFILEWIDTLPQIVLERTIPNAPGTLAMARQTGANTASSQFFINIVDNSNRLGTAYSVFGELVSQETELPLLEEMGDAWPFDLTSIFRTAPVASIPLYTPFWDEKGSYLRFPEISIPAGNPEGISYDWEFVDLLGTDPTDEEIAEQEANRAAFDIAIEGSNLVISRSDTGAVVIDVSGTFGDQTRTFSMVLRGYNPEALDAFPNFQIETGGWLTTSWYGRLQGDHFPAVFHENHGNQAIYRVEEEAADGSPYAAYYIYDSRLESWMWTAAGLYPILYVFEMEAWLEYVEDTGNGINHPRWFWNYTAEEWFNDGNL